MPRLNACFRPFLRVAALLALWLALDVTVSPAAPAPAATTSTTLFVASLRPAQGVDDSSAYGTATLLLSDNSEAAQLTVAYSNLTSTKVASHLKLGAPGEDGRYLQSFYGDEQPIRFSWNFAPTGDLTTSELKKALNDGRIYVAIDTKRHPTGELRGQLIRANGSRAFTPPAAPPALTFDHFSEKDAARFLIQATFGPKKSEIDALVAKGPVAWLDEQMALPATSHVDATRADYAAYPPANGKPRIRPANRQAAWWQIAVTSQDQLRQRVAFALSEIFVVSDINGALGNQAEALASYYDLLARSAFGNFRQLLEDVTLSPVMGAYLSHLRNAKGDPARGTSPDENFAREVMQLFTIGLNELQPDGTYKLGADGLPISTYDQATVMATARVFTGWGFHTDRPRRDFRARPDFLRPMMLYPALHDDGPKSIVGGIRLPARQGGLRDLEATLDALFRHPNTAPFISRRLIQRLVTSNPSPGYVYRVAQVFEHNARGERGDLGAVVRAILLDYEARSPDVIANLGHGKLKEPLLRATALLRAFDGSAKSQRYAFPNADAAFGQSALHSPTVFNFFEPDYVVPGPLAAAGLRAPEYQILTDTTAITIPNQLRTLIYTPDQPPDDVVTLQLDPLTAAAASSRALIAYCDLIFCGGGMTGASRARIEQALDELPRRAGPLLRARCVLELTVTSADAAIQR